MTKAERDKDMIESIEMWLHEIEPKWVEKELAWLDELRTRLIEEKSEKPMNQEDLEEVAAKYEHENRQSILSSVDIVDAFITGAEWGARHSINWGDIQLLDTFILELSREEKDGADWGDSEKFYTEVLRRFHEFNDKKIPEIVAEWGAKHLK